MKTQILKIAGVKNEEELYRKYPTEESFMKAHGKEFNKLNKAQVGMDMNPNWIPTTTSNFSAPTFAEGMTQYRRSQAPATNFSDLWKATSPKQGLSWEKALSGGLPVIENVAKGFQRLKDEREELAKARQWKGVTDVLLKASQLPPEQTERKYLRPEDVTNTGGEYFPIYGAGTNVLSKGGQLKKAQGGFSAGLNAFNKAGGADKLGNIATQLTGGESAGSIFGGAAADAINLIPEVGPVVGTFAKPVLEAAGNILDTNPEKTKKARNATSRNISNMMLGQGLQGIRNNYSGYMEEGGQLTNPQLITKFGEHKLSDLLKPDKLMDTLRTGGNIRSNMENDGELSITKGSARPISYNPFLPDGGETVEFVGPSHANGGIPISYGSNGVEVEGGEPAMKLQEGGEDEDLIIFGNLKAPGYGGKTFKSVVKDISEKEDRQNKIIDKTMNKLDTLQTITPYDKLSLNTSRANILGATMKQQQFADEKQHLAAIQQAINDTAQEMGLSAEHLSKGKIKIAKQGTNISKAPEGKIMSKDDNYEFIKKYFPQDQWQNAYKVMMNESGGDSSSIRLPEYNPGGGQDSGLFQINSKYHPEVYKKGDVFDPEYNVKAAAEIYKKEGWKPWVGAKKIGLTGSEKPIKNYSEADRIYNDYLISQIGDKKMESARSEKPIEIATPAAETNNLLTDWIASRNKWEQEDYPTIATPASYMRPSLNKESVNKTLSTNIFGEKKTPEERVKPLDELLSTVSSLVPYFRPSDVESLDPKQIAGELSALTEKEEPVQAQLYHPQLFSPYKISLQDQLNEITSQTRAAQRMAGNNPVAQSIIASNAYDAKNKVLAEEFRANQTEKERVSAENINLLNQAQLQNLGILDTQYQRQAQAKANTKAILRAAMSSISNKYLQNQLENRTLATYENLYNYRFDPRFRAINYNPPATFDIEGAYRGSSSDLSEDFKPEYELDPTTGKYEVVRMVKKTKAEKEETSSKASQKRNGAIVKALKNL